MTVDIARVKSIVDKHLGNGLTLRHGEVSYFCPFCNHRKRKLQANFLVQKWHCWVCNASGISIASLLRKSNAPIGLFKEVKDLYGGYKSNHSTKSFSSSLALPEDYKPLHIKQNTPAYKQALHYATTVRGLSAIDILRYQIGYCEEGPYGGMLILPSYDGDLRLNFFTARSYYRETATHKNPPVSKDIVGFESQIDWSQPVVIVEGGFDAIAVKRNAIPLFGKVIQPRLKMKLASKSKQVYLALDKDAFKDCIPIVEDLLQQGLSVKWVDLPGKDPSEVGYCEMVTAVEQAKPVDFAGLIRLKLGLWR